MKQAAISVQDLTKIYSRTPEREAGLRAAFKSLAQRRYQEVEAIRALSFSIAQGEAVGLIGPNGAGKTTTLKILSGLLYPTSGSATVAGHIPWQRQRGFLQNISMVLGNKSQMIWDIPPLDTFLVLGEIYRVPPGELHRRLDELVAMLDLQDLLKRPVRNLSLGERMKCELAAGLLHRPAVLFLDEPTLGLDVSMQQRLRGFLREYNRRYGATILLTSHYLADVTALCPRVILIHKGQLLYEGTLNALAQRLAPFKLLRLTLENGRERSGLALPDGVEVLEQEDHRLTLRVKRERAPAVTAELLSGLAVADLTVEDPPLEAVIDQVYQEGTV